MNGLQARLAVFFYAKKLRFQDLAGRLLKRAKTRPKMKVGNE